MPELPEVEVLRRSLEPIVVGATLESFRVSNADLREPVDLRRLEKCRGREIIAARRRAKYLLLDLSGGETLVVHLGMSGRLALSETKAPLRPHEHVTIHLDSAKRLRFIDPRRFGLLFAQSTAALAADRHFVHLGVEPLSDDFSGELLRDLASGRRAPIKSFLMDAKIVVGVGNIYASEALHRAGVHPSRSAGRISLSRWHRLADAIRETLTAAIDQGGTTLNDFADATGRAGYFAVSLAVYDREGQSCQRCGSCIRRIVQAGRSTYYCPGCQR